MNSVIKVDLSGKYPCPILVGSREHHKGGISIRVQESIWTVHRRILSVEVGQICASEDVTIFVCPVVHDVGNELLHLVLRKYVHLDEDDDWNDEGDDQENCCGDHCRFDSGETIPQIRKRFGRSLSASTSSVLSQ